MAVVFPSGYNTFVPQFDATGQLVIGYSRNPKDFPINKYVTIVPVKRSIGYYLKLTAENAARILNSNIADAIWNDGNDAPSGEWNNESFQFLSFTTSRYAFPFRLGYKSIQQADWKILATSAANTAQQGMTGRTLNVANLLLNPSNWTASHVSSTGTLVTTGPATETPGALNAGTASNPLLKKAINRMAQRIQRDTLGVVRPRDLVLVMSPTLADELSRSAEIHQYLQQSPWALAQVRGDSPSQNGLWGLPDALYGVPAVIEDTVIVPYRKSAASPLSAPTLTVGAAASGGALTAGTYYYKVTAVYGPGETAGSTEQSGTTSGGNLKLPLSWTAVPYAVKYNIYRGTSSGAENKLIATVGGLSYTDAAVGSPPTASPPASGSANLTPLYMWEQQSTSPNPLLMLARPGQLVAQGTSTFSTIILFMFEEMTVESRDDPDNRRTMGRVVEDYSAVITSDISGYMVQDALS